MSFENIVYQQLDALKPGERIRLDPKHPNYTRFVELAKEYIDTHKYGNGIEFSADYLVVKKQSWPVTTQRKILNAKDSK